MLIYWEILVYIFTPIVDIPIYISQLLL